MKAGGNAFTAKNVNIARAPKLIRLLGGKARPEPAQHIIEFPGGAVEVSRTADGYYWAHIIINRRHVWPDTEGPGSAFGEVVRSRLGHAGGIDELPHQDTAEQFAVLIRPVPNGSR